MLGSRVPDSERVIFLGQGQRSEPAPWDAVLISRGYYMELVEWEMLARQHGLQRE